MSAVSGVAYGGNSSSYTISCPGTPYQACAVGLDFYISQMTASNNSNAYQKCEKITRVSNGVIYSRNCYAALYVHGYNNDRGLMNYPNYSIHMDGHVGNDTSVHHGLNGTMVY